MGATFSGHLAKAQPREETVKERALVSMDALVQQMESPFTA